MRFSARGHEVFIVDNFSRRRWHHEHSTDSLTPISSLGERIEAWRELSGRSIQAMIGNIDDGEFLDQVVADTLPEAVIHYGEQPSAPYSMISRRHAVNTQQTNVIGTLNLLFSLRDRVPDCHLVKLGTMGEYGTPNIDIEEGFIEIEHKGRKDTLPYPKLPGSIYHLSKVHDSHNIHFACRDLGPARDRPQPGRRLRHRDRRDGARRAAVYALRLRRDLRHRAQPLLRAGRDRPPAHRLRQGRADARVPEHPRHAAVRRAGGQQPRRARRVPRLQPVHRAVHGDGAGRAGQARRPSRSGSR